jgi:hypothetical protein
MRIALLVLLSATLSAQQVDTGPGNAAADAYYKSKLLRLEKERLEMERQLSQQRLEVEQQRLEIERKSLPGPVALQAPAITIRVWPKLDLLAKTTYVTGFGAGFQWAASMNAKQHPEQATAVESMSRCLAQIRVSDLSDAIDKFMNEIQEEDRDAPLWGAVSLASIKICKANGSL